MSDQDQNVFFDEAFSKKTRKQKFDKFYSITKASNAFYKKYLSEHIIGKRILEYGCGRGSFAFYAAQQGAKEVSGIDISEKGIEIANQRTKESGLTNASFYVMNAEAMSFKDKSFDIVCGCGILHHLDIDLALSEINRVLVPDGKAIFLEPMGYNPFFNLYRKLTPKYRVRDEHPLKRADFKCITQKFNHVTYRFFYLFTFLAIPFFHIPIHSALVAIFNFIDQILFKIIPGLKFLSWQVIVIAEMPLIKNKK